MIFHTFINIYKSVSLLISYKKIIKDNMALAGVYTKMDMPQIWGLRNPRGISVLEVCIVKFFDINWVPVNWLGCLINYKNTIIRTLIKNDSPRNWVPSQVSPEIKWESYIFKFCEFDWTLVNWLACLLIFWFFFPKELNKLREAWLVNLAITFMWFFLYFMGGLPVIVSVHVSFVIFLGLHYLHSSLPSYWLTLALVLGIYLNIVVLACLGVLWLVASYLLIKVHKDDRQLLLKSTSFVFVAVQIWDMLDSVWLTVCISIIILYVYGDKMSKMILSKNMQLLLSQVSFLAVLNIVIPWVFLPFWINLIFLNCMFIVSSYLWGCCWFTILKNYKL